MDGDKRGYFAHNRKLIMTDVALFSILAFGLFAVATGLVVGIVYLISEFIKAWAGS